MNGIPALDSGSALAAVDLGWWKNHNSVFILISIELASGRRPVAVAFAATYFKGSLSQPLMLTGAWVWSAATSLYYLSQIEGKAKGSQEANKAPHSEIPTMDLYASSDLCKTHSQTESPLSID